MTDPRILAELERIRLADPDGVLRPEAVVEAARRRRSPLHDRFTWDDTEAARLFRLQQARYLIRVSVKVLPYNTEPVRAYVSISTDRPTDRDENTPLLGGGSARSGGYRLVDDVLNDKALEAQMLQDALNELRRFQRKYRRLTALSAVFRSIQDVLTHEGESDG